MSNLKNSEYFTQILQMLVQKIARRTDGSFARKAIVSVLKELIPKYDFMKYVDVGDDIFAEKLDIINIKSEIDTIPTSEFYPAVEEFILLIVNYLKTHADFYFIKELREAIEDISGLQLKEDGINLNLMQFQYICEKKQAIKPERSESRQNEIKTTNEYDVLIQKILTTLLTMVSMRTSKSSAIAILAEILNDLEKKYDMLQYVKIERPTDSESLDVIKILPEMNSVEPYKLGKTLREVIKITHENIGGNIEEFIKDFKKRVGEEYLLDIEKIGVNLHFLELKYSFS